MKFNQIKRVSSIVLLALAITSCEDFLDKEPPSYASPEDYYRSEDQIQATANKFYSDLMPTHVGNFGLFGADRSTDNQADLYSNTTYVPGQWKVSMNNGSWSWGNIRNINYSLNTILDRYAKGEITGTDRSIRHYIGEIYFFRANCYFSMLRSWGDLPIMTEVLPDEETVLVAANKRMPRNEVARFILGELDKAAEYMSNDFDPRRNRLSIDVALLLKSRVALFEGSWLTYFKGTPFVPNGEGWPGKAKEYNANYEYPLGDIDKEITYFLTEAAASAELVADKYKGKLSRNTGRVPQSALDADNPYFSMFGNTDMSTYPDVLLWREYSKTLEVTHNIEVDIQHGNNGIGLTRSMVENFVMKDGKPIYASHNGFAYNDQTIADIRANADPRLNIFLKEPGQKNVFKNMDSKADHFVETEPLPHILLADMEKGYSTGYAIRKGGTFDKALCDNYKSYTALVAFRATEALLNYMEAQYLLTNNINSGKTLEYWKAVRTAAGFEGEAIDPQTTIAATDINREKLDWGAYSAGKLLTDPVLYNIRRERRSEFMAEGMRWLDLMRWRAMDQMTTEPYHVEGFHLWNTPMQQWYNAEEMVTDGSSGANVSSSTLSEYVRPYEKNMTSGNLFRNGYIWSMAHYLEPMPIKQFLLTSSDHATIELSPLYQNPYWPTTVEMPAEK